MLRGEVMDAQVNMMTVYGALSIPMRKCAGIALEDAKGRPQAVVTINFNRVTGIITDPGYHFRMAASGEEIVLHKERIRFIVLKRVPAETSAVGPEPKTDLFEMANGDLLTGTAVEPKFALRTDYGVISLSFPEIVSLEVQDPRNMIFGVVEKNGDTLHGTLQTEGIALRLDIGVQTQPIYKDNFVKIFVDDGNRRAWAAYGGTPSALPAPAPPPPSVSAPSAPAPVPAKAGGYLGVSAADAAGFVQALGLPDGKGAYVGAVQPGTPAQKCGLLMKDVIRKVNGQPVENAKDIVQKISSLAPGTPVKLEVWRDKAAKEIDAVLMAAPPKPPTPMPVAPPPPPPPPSAAPGPKETAPRPGGFLGVGLADVQPFVQTTGLPDAKGAYINAVLPGTPAEKIGLKSGDVIRQVNGQAVENVHDFMQKLSSMQPGASVKLGIWRDKALQDFDAVLIAVPPQYSIPQPAPAPPAPAPVPPPLPPAPPAPAPVAPPLPPAPPAPAPVPPPPAPAPAPPAPAPVPPPPAPAPAPPAPVPLPPAPAPEPKQESPAPKAKTGGYLGVGVGDVQQFADALGLPDPKGAFVKVVQPGTPAERAGFQPYDVIRKMNGQPIENAADLVSKLAAILPSTTIKIEVWRNKASKEIEAALSGWPQEPTPPK